MTKLLLPLSLLLAASAVRADAFSELRRIAGPSSGDLSRIAVPAGSPAGPAAAGRPEPMRVTSQQWNRAFPVPQEAIAAAGLLVGTKKQESWACEYYAGSTSVRCDYAYNVWPEMCWYGYDHVVADLTIKTPDQPKVVLREWRAN